MTTTECKNLITPFCDRAEKQNDPYLIVHFSRQEDHYKGYHEGMDAVDAMIVIKHLVRHFKIDPLLLNTAI
jgi:hypothetical protein